MGNDWFHEYFINELKAIGRKPTSNMQHEVVDSLPSSGNEQTIYFVKNDSSSSNNHYDEYVWISSSSTFEKIGSTQIDGSTTQPDWNQNDDTQPDYVKNRPFYTGDPVETVLVEETTLPFEDSGEGFYMGGLQSTIEATLGEIYKVSWDSVTYECTCISFNDMPVIGNLSIAGFGSDSGEPFLIVIGDNQGIQIAAADTSASHTFSISGIVAQIVKIDDKYVSDTFRDIVTAGDPLQWSKDDWATYYGLFQGGKLLKINTSIGSNIESYVLSMFYNARVGITQITTITTLGGLYYLSTNPDTNECYWSPVFDFENLYLHYIQTGSGIDLISREEYTRLDLLNGLSLTTKKANEDAFPRKVVLEGDEEIVLSSSTANSTKKFKITVDDNSSLKVVNTSNSSEVTIAKTSDIPTDDHINELINTALSAIGIAEEGAY